MKVSNTKEIQNHFLKILVYGPPGHGKTRLAQTTGGKTLVVSVESGLLSIAGADVDFVDITVDSNDKPLQPQERIEKLRKVYEWIATDKPKYKWIVLDSISEISEIMVAALNREFPDRKDGLVLWGENAKRMTAIIKAFRDLPKYNVMVTALSKIEKDENGKRFTAVDLTGKMSGKIPQYFDEVFYLDVNEEGERRLITQPTGQLSCKDRSGKLEHFEVADISTITKKILGEYTNA